MNQPNEYAATNATQIRNILELIGQFSEEFRNMNGRIIDIGCGPGNTTRDVLVPCVGREAVIVGADISPEMIEYANQHYAVSDKLSFLELDMQTSELPKDLIEQFDHAVSFYALHWCKNTQKALQNIYKLLRPGGKAIIVTISHHMIYDMYPEQEKDPRFAPYMQGSEKWTPPHQGCADADEMMKKDLIAAKFKVEYCVNKWNTYTYPSLDTLVDLVMAVNPCVNKMPNDVQKECREDMKERLKTKCVFTKGSSSVGCRFSVLTIVIQKPENSEEIN
ncbi:juvenile hormone acid O-methyltransferase-like [Bactrocera dorsalis]|uniref:Juvenile hormone acid O-methyltransferase-like n=1 Tax=Bactrocera dorsalis TaxID=27457 RepID=A0ABM3K182_BACDO|nr:juvenile hormone acid O-methyltransferase-like [Bactrocera dorsalis]